MEPIKYIVFDLDETLIHSIPTDLLTPVLYLHLKSYDYFKLQDSSYTIIIRPYFYECISYLQTQLNIKIAIWTSAEKQYAEEIINYLFKKQFPLLHYPEFVYYRSETIHSNSMFGGHKHLYYIECKNGWKMNQTIIIDDSKETILTNMSRGIIAPKFTFYFGSFYDTFLLQIKEHFTF